MFVIDRGNLDASDPICLAVDCWGIMVTTYVIIMLMHEFLLDYILYGVHLW